MFISVTPLSYHIPIGRSYAYKQLRLSIVDQLFTSNEIIITDRSSCLLTETPVYRPLCLRNRLRSKRFPPCSRALVRNVCHNIAVSLLQVPVFTKWRFSRPWPLQVFNLAFKLLSTEFDFLRRSARKSKLEELLENEEIWRLAHKGRIMLENIQRRKIVWYGQINKIESVGPSSTRRLQLSIGQIKELKTYQ